jgi:hypothetical protein
MHDVPIDFKSRFFKDIYGFVIIKPGTDGFQNVQGSIVDLRQFSVGECLHPVVHSFKLLFASI